MKISYLHLGSDDDAFYGKLEAFMRLGAEQLGVELETIPCYRDADRIRREGQAVLERADRPDFLLLPNHKGLALQLVPQAGAAGIKVFLVTEGLLVAEKATLGQPGEKHPHWLGEIVPDDRQYGQAVATHLVDAARSLGLDRRGRTLRVVNLSGGFNFASISRIAGLRAVAARQPDVEVLEAMPANWELEAAREHTAAALKKHSDVSVVWAASDLMARGAIEALEAAGRQPGQDVVVGGVDWAPFVVDMVRSGSLSVSAGSHFMDGAWALVMAYDHHHGVDAGPVQIKSQPALLSRETLERYAVFFDPSRWREIDFERFSRHRNRSLTRYDFSVDAVLRAIGS